MNDSNFQNDLMRVIESVRANPRYRVIDPELVRRLAERELAKWRSIKETVKAVRSKLHQVGGAYMETAIDFDRLSTELGMLPSDPEHPDLRAFCRRVMAMHASTRERLPDLEIFYRQMLEGIAPVSSILDLACGLNSLSLPWMPLLAGGSYDACDIFQDMVNFADRFRQRLHIPGQAFVCDLTRHVPQLPARLALLLKTLPCLEQLEKDIAPKFLDCLQAEYLLVSFPARSLGGRSKGMVKNYEERFLKLIQGSRWVILKRCLFTHELAYLLRQSRG